MYVVSSGGQNARLWDANTGREIAVLSDNLDAGTFATWNPEGDRIVTTGLGSAAVWDVPSMLALDAEGQEPIPLMRHTNNVPAMHLGTLREAAWRSDGSRILTVSANGTAEIWDTEGGQTISLIGHSEAVHHGMWDSLSEYVLTAGGDGARVWDATTGQQITLLSGGGGAISDAAWNPLGTRVATASVDGEVRIWSVSAFDEVQSFMASVQERSYWNSDGSRIATSGYDTLVWDVQSGEEIMRIGGDFAQWDKEGSRLLVAMQDGSVRIWDSTAIRQGGVVDSLIDLTGHTDEVIHASWSPNGRSIATVSEDATVRVWDVQSGIGKTLLQLEEEPAVYSEWTAAGDALLIVHPQSVYVWGTLAVDQDLVQRFAIADLDEDVMHAAWSPDGTKIITSSSDGVDIWDGESGRLVQELTNEIGGANYTAWSPDGERVLTANLDNTVRIWEAASGQLLAVLAGHNGPVDYAVWDPSGKFVLTASLDSTAGLWDAVSGKTLGVVSGYFGAVRHVAWSSDGSHFAPTSWGGPVRVFALAPGNTPEEACSLAVRNMTTEEWMRYLPDEACRATCPEVENLCR
jgi:WD40 repeat protein